MEGNKYIQSFNEHQENLNISDVIKRIEELKDEVLKDETKEKRDAMLMTIGMDIILDDLRQYVL